MKREVRLSRVIAPPFYALHNDLKAERFTHYWLKGGRGSGKSSFISLEIILGILHERSANAVILRKVGETLKDSVFSQLQWAIEILGVDGEWEARTSPLELRYKPTGQRIVFRGSDKPKKIKSTKFKDGYCKYLWFEEVDEFSGADELRTIMQSLLRGGEKFAVFYSFNPPKSRGNWVNQEVEEVQRTDRRVHHSTYLDMPQAWLGAQFIQEAAYLKAVRNEAYRHEYLGEAIGTGGEVFKNITLRPISEEELRGFDAIARGLDWGYAVDPLHYTVNHYDRRRRRLYIFYELRQAGLSNRRAAEEIRKENRQNGVVICDSAEPKSIAELNDLGVRVLGAKKGPDSVDYGIKWLQDLEEIIIDPIRCPETAREFSTYELSGDGYGGFFARFPDQNNHSIDAVRYSREMDMRNIKVR